MRSFETCLARSRSSSASPRPVEPLVSFPATNPPSPTARQAALTLVAFHFIIFLMFVVIGAFAMADFACVLASGPQPAIFSR
jgi:hypothetical protein